MLILPKMSYSFNYFTHCHLAHYSMSCESRQQKVTSVVRSFEVDEGNFTFLTWVHKAAVKNVTQSKIENVIACREILMLWVQRSWIFHLFQKCSSRIDEGYSHPALSGPHVNHYVSHELLLACLCSAFCIPYKLTFIQTHKQNASNWAFLLKSAHIILQVFYSSGLYSALGNSFNENRI